MLRVVGLPARLVRAGQRVGAEGLEAQFQAASARPPELVPRDGLLLQLLPAAGRLWLGWFSAARRPSHHAGLPHQASSGAVMLDRLLRVSMILLSR